MCKQNKLENNDKASEFSNILNEWQIWSKCFGKVFVINGNSCTGKTTFTCSFGKLGFHIIHMDIIRHKLLLNYANKYYQKVINEMKTFLSEDEILKVLYGYKFIESKYPNSQVKFIRDFSRRIF